MACTRSQVIATVNRYLAGLDGDIRTVAPGEWGLTLEAGGWPLHVGLHLRDGVLRAQAQVVDAETADPESLLFWNRSLPLVSFNSTRAGEAWLKGDLPLVAVSDGELDRLLGTLVRVAAEARERLSTRAALREA